MTDVDAKRLPVPPTCISCGKPGTRLQVKKLNHNHGRYFYSCKSAGVGCSRFFKWEDDVVEKKRDRSNVEEKTVDRSASSSCAKKPKLDDNVDRRPLPNCFCLCPARKLPIRPTRKGFENHTILVCGHTPNRCPFETYLEQCDDTGHLRNLAMTAMMRRELSLPMAEMYTRQLPIPVVVAGSTPFDNTKYATDGTPIEAADAGWTLCDGESCHPPRLDADDATWDVVLVPKEDGESLKSLAPVEIVLARVGYEVIAQIPSRPVTYRQAVDAVMNAVRGKSIGYVMMSEGPPSVFRSADGSAAAVMFEFGS